MTHGYGSENAVYVPAGGKLEITGVYEWHRTTIDLRASTVRIREHAATHLDSEIERILGSLKRRKDLEREVVAEARVAARRFRADLVESQAARIATRPLAEPGGGIRWWLRLTDEPAESFHSEDYEEAADPPRSGVRLPLYGSCMIRMGDEAEIPFPAEGENAAFEWILPDGAAIAEGPAPYHEPLPLIHEFCGTGGSSARGATVGVTCRGELSPAHTACSPIRIVGEGVFATLYFSRATTAAHRVMLPVPEERVARLGETMAKSRFDTVASGDNWSVHDREGDIVHLYRDLDGREADGFPVIPGLIVVAAASGRPDPAYREALLNMLLEASRPPAR